jgi:hypothetical protein
LTMHNIFKSFRRKSESRCFSSVFDCPVLLSSYEKSIGSETGVSIEKRLLVRHALGHMGATLIAILILQDLPWFMKPIRIFFSHAL